MRLVPIGWLLGCSSFATCRSSTISAIFARTKSAAVSFAALFSARSLYADIKVRPPRLPARFVVGAALIVAFLQRAALRDFRIDAVARHLAGKAPDLGIILAKGLPLLLRQRRVARRNREVRGTLKDRQVARLRGNHGHRLNQGRPRADNPNPQAGEIHRLM